jgi:hypothetical protein
VRVIKISLIKNDVYVSHASRDYSVRVVNMKVPPLLEQYFKKHLLVEASFSSSDSKLQKPS